MKTITTLQNQIDTTPLVGIYWFVKGELVADAVALEEAEPYADALQHGGHYEWWESLRPQTPAERVLKYNEYEHWPRGRVVYFVSREIFRIYVDPCLSEEHILKIVERFILNGQSWETETDQHYRCAGCHKIRNT
ncbi:MAG TPA: hypothetical protein HPP76_06255 [Desulfuromonadales bacterium]|nr:hypothetical protein [Desulfuromonadales bacterium]